MKSIRFRLFLLIIIFSVLPISIMERVVHSYYNTALINDKIAKIQTQAAVLADQVSAFPDVSETTISSLLPMLEQYSTVNDVRVMIVNTKFIIAADTYYFEKNKTLVSSNVMKSFSTSKVVAGYDSSRECIEVVMPVFDSDKHVMAAIVVEVSSDEINQFSTLIAQNTYVVKISIITIIVFLAGLVAMFFAKPFNKAFETVELVAMGHYDKRIDQNGYTELVHLSENFNNIMDKVHTLDESRQEFVSNVSHELKTPITSMKVLADSLNNQEDVPIELYKEFMQDIVDEIDRESKIIDDLLSLVKMDKSASALNITSVNINEILELVLKRLKPIAQKKNIELLFESFRPVVAEIDEMKFSLAISNLVENAIKYNIMDGWVHVSLNADHQYFYIRVEDSGIGIPQESQSMIFDRFYRVDKARSRESGGTGLGLAIVKNSILMHHGSIKLHSEENVGTTFTVRIPLNYIE